MNLADSRADSYEALYREFDSPLMRELRREAYGESVVRNAAGRMAAMEDCLEAVIELAQRRALSRVMYLSESQGMHS
jgi:hypothetical protein